MRPRKPAGLLINMALWFPDYDSERWSRLLQPGSPHTVACYSSIKSVPRIQNIQSSLRITFFLIYFLFRNNFKLTRKLHIKHSIKNSIYPPPRSIHCQHFTPHASPFRFSLSFYTHVHTCNFFSKLLHSKLDTPWPFILKYFNVPMN